MKDLLCVLGLIFIIEGLPYFVFPEKIKLYLAKVIILPDSTLRFAGITAMIVGLIILYIGKT